LQKQQCVELIAKQQTCVELIVNQLAWVELIATNLVGIDCKATLNLGGIDCKPTNLGGIDCIPTNFDGIDCKPTNLGGIEIEFIYCPTITIVFHLRSHLYMYQFCSACFTYLCLHLAFCHLVSNVPAHESLSPLTAPERPQHDALDEPIAQDEPMQPEYSQPEHLQSEHLQPDYAQATPQESEPLTPGKERFEEADKPTDNLANSQKPKEKPDSFRLSKEEALAELAKALDPYDYPSDEEIKPQTSQDAHSVPEILDEEVIVPTEHAKDESPMNFSDYFKERPRSPPPREEPLYQESPKMSRSGPRRAEKRRPRTQDDGDESDSSSLDEHPVAGVSYHGYLSYRGNCAHACCCWCQYNFTAANRFTVHLHATEKSTKMLEPRTQNSSWMMYTMINQKCPCVAPGHQVQCKTMH
jgi:hypothetical protein